MSREIRVLAADSDGAVREIIKHITSMEGWFCDLAGSGIDALKRLRRNDYELLIIDAELRDIDGYIVCRHFRKSSQAPVILTSRQSGENERLEAFHSGANDFVIKPFYPQELVARAHNLIKLCGLLDLPKSLSVGAIRIDLAFHSAFVDGRKISLSPKEYDLLLFFCRNPRQAFSRNMLLEQVWGIDYIGSDRTVDTHIKSLRRKLRPYDVCLQTVWGYGYKFDIE